jgi:hypothetical protein
MVFLSALMVKVTRLSESGQMSAAACSGRRYLLRAKACASHLCTKPACTGLILAG